ncbi:MAG: phosphopantetheine-protein transferase [Chloroflexi bacterium]|nr:phosphopantetheine-protein transferase [Chloroflexota bacterium]MDL1943552.1 4'-phosphopantetheinyl transferase superfamily protein [Chloroflexi bacterium CFX2]
MKKSDSHTDWIKPPADLAIQPRHVDIWRISLDLEPDSVKWFESTLSAEETERAAKFEFPADRHRYVAAHGFLRGVLSRYLKAEPAGLKFSVNSYGKPSLAGHDLEFNLSHSADFALAALTHNRKIGVDVERIRSGISAHVIARQYFSKAEVAELETIPLELRERAFFIGWTRKEAYIKAQGMGLSLGLDSFDVTITPDQPAVLRATRPNPEEAARWTLLSLPMDSRYEAAVAVEGKDLEFRLWDWEN